MKIAADPTLRQRIGRFGKVIEANSDVALRTQAPRHSARLRIALERTREDLLRDKALMRHAVGQMRIAERGDPVRLQLQHPPERSIDALSGLMWKPVHQVDIDGANALAPEGIDCRFGRLEALLAADGGLHGSVEILHAD